MGKAPKKNAGAASGGAPPGLDANEVIILKYLQAQNRPYNATDIFNNLHGQVGKTAVVKSLTTLAERGEISSKTYGKQLVYVCRQDVLPAPSPKELQILDDQVEDLKSKVATEKESLRKLQSDLGGLVNSMTNEQMVERINYLKANTAKSEKRLEELRSGSRRVDPVEKAKVDAAYDRYSKEWKNRKRMCKEILSAITENLPQSPATLMDELGMENDPVSK